MFYDVMSCNKSSLKSEILNLFSLWGLLKIAKSNNVKMSKKPLVKSCTRTHSKEIIKSRIFLELRGPPDIYNL